MERFNPTARHLEKIIVDLLRRIYPVQTLLDVGCGIGVNLKRIHKHFPDIQLTGSDLSEEILNLAEDYVKEASIEYIELDLGKGRIDREFDAIVCSQVLEHIEDDETALKNMALMCRKYMIITVPGGAYNSTSKLVGHYRHYNRDELVKMVKSCGFSVLYVREWGFPFHSLYKFMLDMLPAESKTRIGLGKYGFFKRGVSHILYLLFFCNIFNKGANIILLAERNN